MGLYDSFDFRVPLPLPNMPRDNWQTKDLDCMLDVYTVQPDYTLTITRNSAVTTNNTTQQTSFSGTFYVRNSSNEKNYEDRTHWSIKVVVSDGKVVLLALDNPWRGPNIFYADTDSLIGMTEAAALLAQHKEKAKSHACAWLHSDDNDIVITISKHVFDGQTFYAVRYQHKKSNDQCYVNYNDVKYGGITLVVVNQTIANTENDLWNMRNGLLLTDFAKAWHVADICRARLLNH